MKISKMLHNNSNNSTKFITIFLLIVILIFIKYITYYPYIYSTELEEELLKINDTYLVRDFKYHHCQKRQRIGGDRYFENKLIRVEGGWFVCLDKRIQPNYKNCNVLSFGINTDESFDNEINKKFQCNVHSFDPFIEADRFKKIRNSNKKTDFMLKINDKWIFYRIGLTGSIENVKNKNQIGWIATLNDLLELTQLNNKIIDVFKMDIEINNNNKNGLIMGGEINVLEHLDIDYACKYFKQLLIETHNPDLNSKYMYDLLMRLEKCFSLFYRTTRLIGPNYGGEAFSEKKSRQELGKSVQIKMDHFENELYLAMFLFSTGELHFINRNFI
jgi:hypothetical protein